MRFSVIVPIYNAESCLEKCFESIAQQTFKDFEVIAVLDSCTDGSEEIAKKYADTIVITNVHHSGFSRNLGMDLAKGEYILFTDDDDWWLHEFAFELLDEKLKEEEPDILFYSFIFKGVKYHNPEGGEYLPAFWNKAWKRDFIKDIRCTGEDTYEADVEFQDKALAKNPKIVEWNMALYYYNYMREGSMSDERGR